MLTRRSFIKALLTVGSLSLLPCIRPWDPSSASSPQPGTASQGEEYAGFVLLPEGARAPDAVRYPSQTQDVLATSALSTPSELARTGGFTVFVPRAVLPSLRYAGCRLVSRLSGTPIGGWVLYQTLDPSSMMWVTSLTVAAQCVFPTPFPLWWSEPVEPGGPAVVLEKVSFLPWPGIMVATAMGYAFHWIKDSVLYTLLAEYGPSRADAIALAGGLVPLN